MTTRRSLGRNLSALLSPSGSTLLAEPIGLDHFKLSVQSLQPGKYQPRGEIEASSLEELAASIKVQGILQPLLVRELSAGLYEIIAGERRWRASQIAGLTEVPVIVKQVNDETAMAIALIENLQREDLNAMDQAKAMHRLTSEFGLTHQQVADLLSKSRTAVSNFLRLLTLSSHVKRLLEHGVLDMGHARTLLSLDEEQQQHAAQIIISKNLSVRETEQLVERIKSGIVATKTNKEPDPLSQAQLHSLTSCLNAQVTIKPSKTGKGQLIIHYKTQSNLQDIIDQIMSDTSRSND